MFELDNVKCYNCYRNINNEWTEVFSCERE